MKDAIRTLQKTGRYGFEGLGREESRKAAENIGRAALTANSGLPETPSDITARFR